MGRGLTMLFGGPPGTGKTMAAQVLAGALALDLYRVDLSRVVNKYIGETEKNLSVLFDEAQASGAVLFFDEADALFGKRSEVKDAHDRYANLEIGYLLQRMEEYEGVTILASNRARDMDEAFTRRFQFIIDFPMPDEAHRLEDLAGHVSRRGGAGRGTGPGGAGEAIRDIRRRDQERGAGRGLRRGGRAGAAVHRASDPGGPAGVSQGGQAERGSGVNARGGTAFARGPEGRDRLVVADAQEFSTRAGGRTR